jgi:hypothetical protein
MIQKLALVESFFDADAPDGMLISREKHSIPAKSETSMP